MRLFFLLEIVAYVLVFMLVVTQIVVPAVRGTKMFPFFRREQKIKERIVEARQRQHEEELDELVDAIEAQSKQKEK